MQAIPTPVAKRLVGIYRSLPSRLFRQTFDNRQSLTLGRDSDRLLAFRFLHQVVPPNFAVQGRSFDPQRLRTAALVPIE